MHGIGSSIRRDARMRSILGFMMSVAMASAQSLTVTTLAGTTQQGGAVDGAGATARFGFITGLTIDRAGTMFVSDAGTQTIRKVTPAGVVTTFAGAVGSAGYVDATGPGARFEHPGALILDTAGNLYVGHTSRLRRITPAGAVTTLVAQPGFAGSPSDGRSLLAFNRDPVWGFVSAQAMAFDAAGSLYIADHSRIRRISADARESVLAGQPAQGPALDGLGIAARFDTIWGIAIDAAGNFFVADSGNHAIRKITPAGSVSTFAGAVGLEGFADGVGLAARFNRPFSLAFDRSGNLFVSEMGNRALRKITPAGLVTTVAGNPAATGWPADGVGANASFTSTMFLAFDPAGVLIIGDGTALRKATDLVAAAKIATAPQSQSMPAGMSATFSVLASGSPAPSYQWQRQSAGNPAWLNLSNDAIYGGATTAVLTVNKLATTMNGDRFRCLVSNSGGSDTSVVAVLHVEPPIVVLPLRVSTFAGSAGASAGGIDGVGNAARFTTPSGLALDQEGNLFVADSLGSRIRKITPAGVVTTVAGSGLIGSTDGPGAVARFSSPTGIAIDAAGNLYVADSGNATIRKITPGGDVTTLAGKAGEQGYANGTGAAARFYTPTAIAIERSGNLIVGDSIWLRRVTPAGVVTGFDFHFAAELDDAPLTQIAALAIDPAGNILVACGQTVRKVTPAGLVTTVAGKHVTPGIVDGRVAHARFRELGGIALDAGGNIYVADTGNHTLRKITPAGFVLTVAGLPPPSFTVDTSGSGDGIGIAARFRQPRGLALDRAGNLYIADALNHTVRRTAVEEAVRQGQEVVLSVLVAGGAQPSSYQWRKNGVDIPGALGREHTIAAFRDGDNGDYSVRIVIEGEVSESEPLKLAVAGSRIVNLSIRARVSPGAPVLTVGFVVTGSGMPLLVRGIGPGLAPFGVAAPLADPRLALYAGDDLRTTNDNWSNVPAVAEAAMRVGAFALAGASLDAALLAVVEPGRFTAQCASAGAAGGVVLVELYDAGAAPGCRLVNVSARSHVGLADDVMIAGFSISGTDSRRVLIRAVGPGLRQFGVSGTLADPELRVVSVERSRLVASNDNWGGASEMSATFATAGAFPLAADSRDAAIVETLPPGTYHVVVSGVAAGTGEALVEVYELEP